jgi:P-type Cu+ transporter
MMADLAPALPASMLQADALRAEGKTAMFVAVDGQAAGIVAVADPVKATTAEAIRALHETGLRIIMATGDNELTASRREKLGIDEVRADMLPESKQQLIDDLRANGAKVAMAGDGVNDAPALAAADVGIAMGTGADVAVESAGITLVKGDLNGIVRARTLPRRRSATSSRTCSSPSSTTRSACLLRRACSIRSSARCCRR